MARIKRGQLRKKDISPALRQLQDWKTNNAARIAKLKPEFAQWVHNQCGEIERRINEQDYPWAIQSLVRHLVSTTSRMESGEIVAVSADGQGFTLAPMKV